MKEPYKKPIFQSLIKENESFEKHYNDRKKIVQNIHAYLQKQRKIDQKLYDDINRHCQQYNKLKELLKNVTQTPQYSKKDPIADHGAFWDQNQIIQRDLQERLNQLKNIDIDIDNLVNQEFDQCNQLDQIQQTIRTILNKKDSDHIEKAQPYFNRKQKCLQHLRRKKIQKQAIKEQKIKAIKEILDILYSLKAHRQARLEYCSSSQIDQNTFELINRLIADFQTMKQNNTNSNPQKKMAAVIQENQLRSDRIFSELLALMKVETQTLITYDTMIDDRIRSSFFEKAIENVLPRKKLGYPQLSMRLKNHLRNQAQKGKQNQRIQQGISITNDTIDIFTHILKRIQSENSRRKALLSKIEKLQQKHKLQAHNHQQIGQLQSQLQKLISKKNRLQKTLSSKIDEADVNAYKNIHLDLQEIQKAIKILSDQLHGKKCQCQQHAKHLYGETNKVQEDFKDILSEVIPSIWFRDKDFTKQQTVKDLNLYLIKTFKRLNFME